MFLTSQVHSGKVAGGIVGRTRAFYRAYGETVNLSSRMMSHGMPSTVHCSWETARRLANSPSVGEFLTKPVLVQYLSSALVALY